MFFRLRPARAAFVRCIAILPILLALAGTAWAGWLPDGVPVCTAAGYQGSLVAEPDGAGGMLMAWVDYRVALEQRIYAQRIDIDGNLLWTADGVLVGANPSYHPGICPDGAGGAYVAWDNRSDGFGDIMVQHLDASGNKLWAPVGIAIAVGTGITSNTLAACVEDGLGGVIVAWVQDVAPPAQDNQVAVQRLSSAGTLLWGSNGHLAGADIGPDREIDMAADRPSLGALLGWVSSTGSGVVQRVDLSGTPRMNGTAGYSLGLVTPGSRVRVCDRDRVTQGLYAMNMWTGGLFNEDNVQVAALDSVGYHFWTTVVYGGGYTSPKPGRDFRVIDNGLDGAWAVWDRIDESGGGLGVYAQMLESNGVESFADPVQVSDGTTGNSLPDVALSYYLLVTWVDASGASPVLKYTRVNPSGGYAFPERIVPGGHSGYRPCIVVGDSGHTPDFPNPRIAWQDQRLGPGTSLIDIYASGLQANGDPTQPNLIVTALDPAVEPGLAGSGWSSFLVKVKNTGTCAAGSFWTTLFPNQAQQPHVGDLPPENVQSVHCGPLAAGDSVVVDVLVEAPLSEQYWSMWAFADYRGDVNEFDNEGDNTFGPRTYHWIALPNLYFSKVVVSDAAPYPGESVTATVTLKNDGYSTPCNFYIDYYENRASAPAPGATGDQRRFVPLLAPGDSIVWTTDPVTSEVFAQWRSWFRVDTENIIPELNEGDNLSGPHYVSWRIPEEDGWARAGGANFHSSPAIANLDSDPTTLEVVIGCDDGKLYAWGPGGVAVPGWPVTVGDSIRSSPAVGDIQGDYHNEVVVGCRDGKLYAFDYLGAKLWEYSAGTPVHTTPALADLDGDDKLEIVFGAGQYLYCLEGNGTAYPGTWPYSAGAGGIFTSPAIGNVDGTGALEIAVIAHGYTKPVSSKVFLLRPNGGLYSGSWPAIVDTVVVADPVLGDVLSPDTDLEIVSGGLNGKVYVWNKNAALWPVVPRVAGAIETSPALHNLDRGDSQLEIVVTSREHMAPLPPTWDAYATQIDNDGTVMWSRNTGGWIVTNAPAPSAIVAGKALGDVMVGSPGKDVYCYDRNGAVGYGFPLDARKAIFPSAAIGDTDDDAWLELVVAAGDSVRCWELCSTTFSIDDLWWPMFRHDRARTACYGTVVPTDVEEPAGGVPRATRIVSIYPNPFNPSTVVAFDLAVKARVEVGVYDVSGRRVATLVDRVLEPGRHEIRWNGMTAGGRTASSGVYLCALKAGAASETRKMILLK